MSHAEFSLTLIKRTRKPFSHSGEGDALCKCICGKEVTLSWKRFSSQREKSCGCLKTKFGIKPTTSKYREANPREYIVWEAMRRRCYNPNSDKYKYYGGKGVKICDRWLQSFDNFFGDMGARPTATHSIDRIDVNGDYAPENCRWATKQEQMNNRTDNHFIDCAGVKMTIADAARRYNIKYANLEAILRKGISIEKYVNKNIAYA